MQTKTTGKCHFLTYHAGKGPTLTSCSTSKTLSDRHIPNLSYGNAKCFNSCEGEFGRFEQNATGIYLLTLAITLLGIFHRNTGKETKRHMYQAVHFGTVWNSKKLERTQKPVNIDLVGLAILCLPKGVLYSCKRKCRTFLYSTQTSKLPHALSVLIIVS